LLDVLAELDVQLAPLVRVRLPQPTAGGSPAAPIQRANGIITGGFGAVVPNNVQGQRQGTIVARLTF